MATQAWAIPPANEYATIESVYCPSPQTCPVNPPMATITHDAAGNLTADENDLSYQYDHENHLIGVRYVGGCANVLVASFVYDAQGRMHYAWRRADTDSDGDVDIKHFYYDASNILAEYDNHGPLTLFAPICSVHPSWPCGGRSLAI